MAQPVTQQDTQPPAETLAMDTRLWCMHVSGMDEVHPAPDRATAQRWAAKWTADFARRVPNPGPSDPVMNFTVQEWPWSAEKHAEGLAASIAGNTWPDELPDATTLTRRAGGDAIGQSDGDPDGWLAVKVNAEGGVVMPYGPLHAGPDRPNDARYRWAPFYLGEPQ